MDFELDLSTQHDTIWGELAPLINVGKVNIDLNHEDVEITLSGSLVAKIAN
jgi:hypothetical protein